MGPENIDNHPTEGHNGAKAKTVLKWHKSTGSDAFSILKHPLTLANLYC